jgi:uncharacterized protein (TIGR02452 family)
MDRISIARDTLEILKKGSYQMPGGERIELAAQLADCVKNTRCYNPEELEVLQDRVLAEPPGFSTTTFEVTDETTLQGCERVSAIFKDERIGVLNFASARHPGGGFLSGAQAQEESLARSSGLYPSLNHCTSFYEYHNLQRNLLYSDRMIYSPQCPVFRRDDGTLLEQPYRVDFLTSPAPNAGAIPKNQPELAAEIEPVLTLRSRKILSLSASQGCAVLVLGAWGCGVFQNVPSRVAQVFWEHLSMNKPFWRRFQYVLFAVYDSTAGQKVLRPFEKIFSMSDDDVRSR